MEINITVNTNMTRIPLKIIILQVFFAGRKSQSYSMQQKKFNQNEIVLHRFIGNLFGEVLCEKMF